MDIDLARTRTDRSIPDCVCHAYRILHDRVESGIMDALRVTREDMRWVLAVDFVFEEATKTMRATHADLPDRVWRFDFKRSVDHTVMLIEDFREWLLVLTLFSYSTHFNTFEEVTSDHVYTRTFSDGERTVTVLSHDLFLWVDQSGAGL